MLTFPGGTGPLKIYVDNKKVGEYSLTVNVRGAIMRFMLGRDSWHRYGAHPACKIRLDEVRVYNYALNEAQISELFRPIVSKPTIVQNVVADADNGAARVRYVSVDAT